MVPARLPFTTEEGWSAGRRSPLLLPQAVRDIKLQKGVVMIRETALVRWNVDVNRSAARIGFLLTTMPQEQSHYTLCC